MTKQELRKQYKAKRLALTESERMKLDDLLLIQLQRLPTGYSIEYLLSYWPLGHHAEPDSHLFTLYLQHAIPVLKTCYPKTNFFRGEMIAVLVNDETSFKENLFYITEPVDGNEVLPNQIDMVFVPLLAIDNNGHRVGYGRGFYDRFLSQCRADVVTVGFSYFDPISLIDDKDQFDVPLNFCITPQRIYEF